MSERPKATEAPPARSTPTCATDHQLGTWRQASTIPEDAEARLFRHLAVPCATCWGRLSALTRLQPDAVLPTTSNAVVLALRTVGHHPPPRLLWPRHREAYDAVGEPMGFPWLVVEEARILGGRESIEQLDRWRGVLDDPVYTTIHDQRADALRVRVDLHLSDAHRRFGHLDDAHIACGRATCRLGRLDTAEAPETAQYLALLARLKEPGEPAVRTSALYENAVDALAVPDGSRRTIGHQLETLLEYGQFLIQAKDLSRAWQILRRAEDLPRRADYPTLEVVLWLELATVAFERSKAGKPVMDRYWLAWAVGYLGWIDEREHHLSGLLRDRKDLFAVGVERRFDELTARRPSRESARHGPGIGKGSAGLLHEKFGSTPRIEALIRPCLELRDALTPDIGEGTPND